MLRKPKSTEEKTAKPRTVSPVAMGGASASQFLFQALLREAERIRNFICVRQRFFILMKFHQRMFHSLAVGHCDRSGLSL